jgi:hypothetical protein
MHVSDTLSKLNLPALFDHTASSDPPGRRLCPGEPTIHESWKRIPLPLHGRSPLMDR